MPAEQTYLDISQGNRVFDSLYDGELPSGARCSAAWWEAVDERAASAPADIVPGLLAATLRSAGVGVRAGRGASCAFSGHQGVAGGHDLSRGSSGAARTHAAPAFEARSASLRRFSSLARGLRGEDLLIGIERAPPARNGALAIGIAGRGFGGNLTSDSTRTDGYVLSTDIAPTILARLGIAAPAQMSGQPIRSGGAVDAAEVESLGARMAAISARRGPVIGVSLLVWLLVFGLAAVVGSARVERVAVRLLALSVVFLPLVLLAGAALEPGREGEQLLVMVAAPLLAALALAALGGYRALATASATVVLAYAIDVIAGSPLTRLSLLGPNPGLGVRLYGIGNELEAILAVLVVAGAGAALSGFAPRLSPARSGAAFLATGLLAALVFAAGRFGADVGAAIVLPVGAAVAAAAIAARGRRTALLALAAPLLVLALIALGDLATGANAHLTRSVLDAGGLGDLADVAQRRLQLSAHSFARPIVLAFLPVVAALAIAFALGRERVRAWLAPAPALRAGLLGAVAATAVGTLANDSGALLLEIGTAYILVFAGFAWSERPAPATRAVGSGESTTL